MKSSCLYLHDCSFFPQKPVLFVEFHQYIQQKSTITNIIYYIVFYMLSISKCHNLSVFVVFFCTFVRFFVIIILFPHFPTKPIKKTGNWKTFLIFQSPAFFVHSLLFNILRCNNIHTGICNVSEDYISNMYRCRNGDTLQCLYTLKDFSLRNIFFCLY